MSRGQRVSKLKIPKLKQFDVVEVIWHDAFGQTNWADVQISLDHVKPCEIVSVGQFLGWTKSGYIFLAGAVDSMYPPQASNREYIPKGMIQSIRKIK